MNKEMNLIYKIRRSKARRIFYNGKMHMTPRDIILDKLETMEMSYRCYSLNLRKILDELNETFVNCEIETFISSEDTERWIISIEHDGLDLTDSIIKHTTMGSNFREALLEMLSYMIKYYDHK